MYLVPNSQRKTMSYPILSLALFCLMLVTISQAHGKAHVDASHTVNVEYYSVKNASGISSLEKLVRDTAKGLSMSSEGLTSTDFGWDYEGLAPTERSLCRANTIYLFASTTITLPQLVSHSLTKDELQVWEESFNKLKEHELKHYENHQQGFKEMLSVAAHFEAPCDSFRKQLKQAMSSIVLSYKRVDESIDR